MVPSRIFVLGSKLANACPITGWKAVAQIHREVFERG